MIGAPTAAPPAPTALADVRESVRRELAKVVVGYEEPLELLLVAAATGGHVLLQGPPGIAKTLMAGAVARVLGVSHKRIQLTPDTTAEAITGRVVTKLGEPVFVPGPLFANLVLVDEINRTPPRTQAALLEAMQERQVTIDGRPHWLPNPFMVIATQNPFEQAGVFPLAESQLDRFLFKINLEYPEAGEEQAVLRLPHRGLTPDVLGEIQPVLDVASLAAIQHELDTTEVPDGVASRIVRIVRATRDHPGVALGASPRAAVHLMAAAKATARLAGRDTATDADVAQMAPWVLEHRLIVDGASAADVVRQSLHVAMR